jgi:hypothetical protein
LDRIVEIAAILSTPEEETEEFLLDNRVHDPLLSVPLYDFLLENERLPADYHGKRIIYQLDKNRLEVEIMPSMCHDYAAGAFAANLFRWAESGGWMECLEMGIGGRTILLNLSLTSLDWLYDGISKKSPDNSFSPANLSVPPGKCIGSEQQTSRTPSGQLKLENRMNHGINFAAATGVMLYLGIKIYPTRQIRVCLLERDTVRGFGYIDPPLAETGFIDIGFPCNDVIVVPKRLIFFGVPPALIPPTITPDYHLPVELIRIKVAKNWALGPRSHDEDATRAPRTLH